MRKSPFSTPRGNGNARGGFGWKSNGNSGRGYGRTDNFDFQSPNRNKNSSQSFGGDFIPFDSDTSPSNNRRPGNNHSAPAYGNWQSPGRGNHRKSMSPGFNNYCNNSGWDNQRQSPYLKNGTNNFRGNRKNFHSNDMRKKSDITNYVNLKSFLEDPWLELMRKTRISGNLDDSTGDNVSDLSFNRRILDAVHLDDSVNEDNSTSQESLDGGSETSSNLKKSQDSND